MSRRAPLLVAGLAAIPLLLNAASDDPPTLLGTVGAAALMAALLAAGLTLARRLLGSGQPTPSVLSAAGIAATALLVLPALALGHFGWLDPRLYLAVEAGLTLAVTALLGGPGEAADTGDTVDGGAAPPLPEAGPWWRSVVLAGAFGLALAVLITTAYEERNDPPHKVDDSSYHMITVATWVQHEDLRMPLFQHGDPATPYYPVISEVINWAAVAPLRDSDFFARWAQLPFTAGLLAATAGLALRLGATPATAAVAMLLLLSIGRLFPILTLSAANDVMQAYFIVGTTDALAAWWSRSGRAALGPALYFGVGSGLTVGTKYLGLLLAPPLLLAAAALPWLRGKEAGERPPPRLRDRLRDHFWLLTLAGATAAVVGGYSYLRNGVSVGNPIFPIPLSLGPFDLPGWLVSTKEWRSTLPEFAIRPWAFLVTKEEFTGLTYHVTLLPAAILAPLVCAVRRHGRRWPLDFFLLCLPTLYYLAFVLGVYDHREVRYLFSAYAVAAASFAWLLHHLPKTSAAASRWLPAVHCATALLVCFDLVANQMTVLRDSPGNDLAKAAVGFAAGALFAVGRLHRRWWSHPRRLAMGLLAGSLVVAAALAPAADTQQRKKYANDPVVQALVREDPDGARVLVFGGNRWYRLFGARLQNEVLPGEVGAEHAWYRWGDERLEPARESRPFQWMRRLRGERDAWLVVHPSGTDPHVMKWLDSRLTAVEMRATADGRQLWHVDDLWEP